MFDTLVSFMAGAGLAGVALLMLAETVFPPIPSELVMPLAGFAAARGEMSLPGVVAAGVLGSLAGALLWYALGRRLGTRGLHRLAARHGRWLTMTTAEVRRAERWFHRRGAWAVLLGRLVPAVRTLISVPAGVTGMALGRFLAFSALGTVAWCGLLAAGGFVLEAHYVRLADWLDLASDLVVLTLGLIYVVRVATYPAPR